MDIVTFSIWIIAAITTGCFIGYRYAIDDAKAGKLTHEGINYSYLATDKYRQRARLRHAMRQTR